MFSFYTANPFSNCSPNRDFSRASHLTRVLLSSLLIPSLLDSCWKGLLGVLRGLGFLGLVVLERFFFF